jgi:glycine hydroxymethyltransferase
LNGKQAEDRLAEVGITVNRNAVPFDPRPPAVASGLRIGSPGLATRGMQESDFREIGKVIAEALTGDLDDTKRAALTERTSALAKRYPLYPQLTAQTGR